MDDDFDFDDINDELLLKEIENYDCANSILSNPSISCVQVVDNCIKQPTQRKQLSIYESFGLNAPKPTMKPNANSSKPMASKPSAKTSKPTAKPSFSSVKPCIVYEPITTHKVDSETFKTWIYPINYPIRDYQFNIVQKALFSNTLVALPTGLGKTFIAAVIMYNFYRWFPNGKLVFMAPTKPLVNQQIDACYKITGLPRDMTEELTGNKPPELRRLAWKMKRVFFITPQVLQNDLRSNICNAEDFVLLVFDEAHRASKSYSYCEVMRAFVEKKASFRVLALTATPGSDTASVSDVVKNLMITNIEVRTEDSIDISKYMHIRALELIVVPVSEDIQTLTGIYCNLMNGFLKKLNDQNVYRESNPLNVSSFAILKAREAFRKNSHALNRPPQLKGYIEGIFGVAQSLATAYGNLVQHGITLFQSSLSKFDKECGAVKLSKAGMELASNPQFTHMMSLIKSMKEKPGYFSHLKMERLTNILLKHFDEIAKEADAISSRVIIFTQYRESVDEIVAILRCHSVLRVMSFVGQSNGIKGTKGLSQKEQLEVIRKFKSGNYNVLVCTSIGEEGLDIGEIDLIVCYDSQNSPIRMLQRMGRTGRKRKGKVVLLLTQGREEDSYNRAKSQYKSVQNAIATQQGNKIIMYSAAKDVIPLEHTRPACQKVVMDIAKLPPEVIIKSSIKPKSENVDPHEIYLNPSELQEFKSQFQNQTGKKVDLCFNRYIYRNIIPLPSMNLERSDRSLDFTKLISDLEDLISQEEEQPTVIDVSYSKKASIKKRKYEIQSIGRNEVGCLSSPICFNIGDRSKDISVKKYTIKSPIGFKKSHNIDDIVQNNYGENSVECNDVLEVNSDIFINNSPSRVSVHEIVSDQVNSLEGAEILSDNFPTDLHQNLLDDLDPNQLENLLDSNIDSFSKKSSQTPVINARRKRMIMDDLSSSVKRNEFRKPAPINIRKEKNNTKGLVKSKKKMLDYSNPYLDIEAVLSDENIDSQEDGSQLDTNLSSFIAESPVVQSQEVNFYLKSLLSPKLGGLGTINQGFKFRTPKKYEPCTPQMMPDSDTPGSLADFVVEDSPIVSGLATGDLDDDKHFSLHSNALDELLETCSSESD